jgi:hypothetical protein
MTELSDPAIDALWKNVLDHWDEDKAHAVFLEACRERGQLAEAASRYRGMSGDRERGPGAEKRLKSVLAIAMAELEVSRTHEPATPGRAGSLLMLAIFVVGTIGLMVYLALAR